MWNKISQAAGLAPVESEDEKAAEKSSNVEESMERLQQQELLIQQLKDLVRENERKFQEKSKEYDELSSKFQKFKLQSKAKISNLSSQIKDQDKPKKEDCDFDDTSSSDSSDQSRRGKVLLLKKQLEQAKQQLEKKEQESKTIISSFEKRINDLELQLNEKNNLISSLVGDTSKAKEAEAIDKSPKKDANVQEMYAQIVYKDAKIMELNNQILEHEKNIMDLQEHIREKDEVLQQRNRAVQLMAEDMSRKGKSVVDELDETREQMKIMQENFSSAESDWKKELEKYKLRISELEKEITDYDKKIKNSEATIKTIESAKYELSVKNAELQKKIVCVQESAAKQCELYTKEIEGEVETLKKSLEAEKQHAAEIQKALDESSSQSDNKVLKARVKERTKYKALERELNELKKNVQQKPDEIVELQQRVAELEEEKGSLQLKLMDFEDQVIQIDKLKEENEILQNNMKEKLIEVQNLQKKIDEIQSERDGLEVQLKSLQDSNKELEKKCDAISKEKTILEDRFIAVSKSREESVSNYSKLQDEYARMQCLFNDASDNLQKLQDQNVTFEMKNIELEEIRESDEMIMKELHAEIEQLKESFYSESKPDIQLEKENSELKDELRIQKDKCKKLENEMSQLLSDFDKIKKELSDLQQKHSVEIEQLNSEIKTLDVEYKKVIYELESKTEECVKKNKLIIELEGNFSSVQNELSCFFSDIGVKDLNDCKNYAIKKAEECLNLKNDYDKEVKEKANLLISLQEKDEALQKLGLKFEKLLSVLENRDAELKSLEDFFEKLNEIVSEKENIISKISSGVEEKVSSEKMLMAAVQEKTQLLSKAELLQRNLELELQAFKDTQLTYQEKMKANSSSLLGQISDLETELGTLRDELTSKTKAICDLNEVVQNVKKENEKINLDLKEKENLIQEKIHVIENFESVILLNKDEVNCLNQEKESIKAEILVKDAQVMESNQKLQQLQNEFKMQEDEFNKIIEDLKSKAKNIDDLNALVLSLRSENEKIVSELEKKENLLQKKDDVIANYDSVDKDNKKEISLLKQEQECIKTEIFTKATEVMELNQKLQQLKSELKKKEGEISHVYEELQEVIKIRSENEKAMQLLKEKNAVLENEKLHSNLSFTEKDKAYNQMLTEKQHLESEVLKLQEEYKSLDIMFKEKEQESVKINNAINKMTDLVDSADSVDAQNFISHLPAGNSSLKQLAERYFSHLKRMQTDADTLMTENSALQSKIEELKISVSDQQLKLQESNAVIEAFNKQAKEFSHKNEELEQELNTLAGLKSVLESQVSEFEMKLRNLTKERDSLQSSLNSSQDGHLLQISALNKEISNFQLLVQDANEKIKVNGIENSKLSQLCVSFEDSVKDYKTEEVSNKKQIQDLLTKISILQEKLTESESEILNCKERIKISESEAELISEKFSKENSSLETSHQTLITNIGNLESSVSNLKLKLTDYEHLNSELKEKLSEKESQINELEARLEAHDVKFFNLQSLYDQKLNENEKYKHLMDTQFPCLQNCVQHYYMMVKGLISSFQLDIDVSFLEKENWESVDEFSVKSKSVVDHIVERSVEVLSQKSAYDILENKVKSVEEENKNLLSQCNILSNFFSVLADSVQSSLKENDVKYSVILSAFQNKEATLESLKSKILILSREQTLQKNHLLELETEKKSYFEKLEENKNFLAKTEEAIKRLKEEKEEINRNSLSVVEQYEEKISQFSSCLEEITSKNNSLSELIESKNEELEIYHGKIIELQNMLRDKDEEISQLCQERTTSSDFVSNLQTELSSAHSTISSLQNEIKLLNKQISECEEESRILESSNNVSNGLQVEVENLKRELSFCEEQRNYLKQHLENTISQLQSLVVEKTNLESTVEQMQSQLNDLMETNINLSNSFEEAKSLNQDFEKKFISFEEQRLNYEKAYQELNSLKSAKSEPQAKERMELMNKISSLEKTTENLKNNLIKINHYVSNIEIFDSDLLYVDFDDETLKMITSELQECLFQNKSHYAEEINSLQCKLEKIDSENRQLRAELGKIKNEPVTSQKIEQVEMGIAKSREKIASASYEVKVDKNVFQQASSTAIPPLEPLTASDNDSQTQKQEVDEYKKKFAKVLSKLKLFKDKNEKLTNEVQELKNQISQLEEVKLRAKEREDELLAECNYLVGENNKLSDSLQSIREQSHSQFTKDNDQILQLKERNYILDEECCRIRKELQEYKHTWEQANVSYELQKEDNVRLREKIKEFVEQVSELKEKISELNMQLVQLKNENVHFHQEAENLREHANMLLSDNGTYQELIEKLTSSKTSLEQKLSNLTEQFNTKLKNMQDQHKLELQNVNVERKENTNVSQSKELEKEVISLRSKCSEMQHYIEKIEKEHDTSLRNQNLLEKEKVYFQHQLLEKVDELQKTKNGIDDIKNRTSVTDHQQSPVLSSNETLCHEINELKDENGNLKSQFSSILQELNLTKEHFEIMKQDFYNKENYYVDRVKQHEIQQQGNPQIAVSMPHVEKNASDTIKLENELQQAMNSLHKQGLRYEELSLDVSKLLEERNIYRWKLQQYGQMNLDVASSSEIDSGASPSDLVSIKVESPSINEDIAVLHSRLMQSEKTCQQLRQANEALDRALLTERDQKKMIEEELDLAKEHLSEEAKASDEYQILLGDINEPEFLAETNFSIRRNIRPHVYRLRRWLRGRRNYVCRMVKSRNYPQLVYIFYIFFIHVWLLTCVFS